MREIESSGALGCLRTNSFIRICRSYHKKNFNTVSNRRRFVVVASYEYERAHARTIFARKSRRCSTNECTHTYVTYIRDEYQNTTCIASERPVGELVYVVFFLQTYPMTLSINIRRVFSPSNRNFHSTIV